MIVKDVTKDDFTDDVVATTHTDTSDVVSEPPVLVILHTSASTNVSIHARLVSRAEQAAPVDRERGGAVSIHARLVSRAEHARAPDDGALGIGFNPRPAC